MVRRHFTAPPQLARLRPPYLFKRCFRRKMRDVQVCSCQFGELHVARHAHRLRRRRHSSQPESRRRHSLPPPPPPASPRAPRPAAPPPPRTPAPAASETSSACSITVNPSDRQ